MEEKLSFSSGEAKPPSFPTSHRSPSPDLENQLQANREYCNSSPLDESQPVPSRSNLSGHVSRDADGNTYPEGGFEAWLVVFGSFSGGFASFGLANSIGTFQVYISSHQLKGYNEGDIGWIFGIYVFMIFFCGVQIGPVFDAKGPRMLVLAGSILTIVALIALGFCSTYWHFMVVIGIVLGVGNSLILTPAISAISHFFYKRRGLATGFAITGGSVGGIVFPLVLESLFPKVGFAWATRVVALICFVLLGIACTLIKSRLPSKPASRENILPDFRIFRDPAFAIATAGVFFIEWGVFIPITYISSYALEHNMSQQFSYQVLVILNVGSFFGRWLPSYWADPLGRFNAIILTVFLCVLSNACFWLLAGNSVALLITYSLMFGFASGGSISLTPVCLGQLCKTEHYGRYFSTAYTIVSFSTLTGIPIAGEILSRCNGAYWGLISFTICSYFAGLLCFIWAKLAKVGCKRYWVIF